MQPLKNISNWEMIPDEAFLYHPQGTQHKNIIGQQIKLGQGSKAWRKIFQNGQAYDFNEQQALQELNEKIKKQNKDIDKWFNQANKLRYLQANKFKINLTYESIIESSKWRKKNIPIKMNDQILALLKSGTFYLCGRDNQYRPIIVADINRFREDYVDDIPFALAVLLQFLQQKIFIEGQIQNYILIMNLENFSFSMKGVIMKILSFTSNSYRGRLYASYLLGMPGLLRFGWDSLISKFVSENTVKKIKISSELNNEEMWRHIDKSTIQSKYGGNLKNITDNFWPVSSSIMQFKPKKCLNKLISIQHYENLYKEKKLQGRKIKDTYIYTQDAFNQISNTNKQHLNDDTKKSKVNFSELSTSCKFQQQVKVMVQKSFIPEIKELKTFFSLENFIKLTN